MSCGFLWVVDILSFAFLFRWCLLGGVGVLFVYGNRLDWFIVLRLRQVLFWISLGHSSIENTGNKL